MRRVLMTLINEIEKPREKLYKYGASSLTNNELICLLIRTGTKDCNVFELSNKILNELYNLDLITLSNLSSIKGVGLTKSSSILASIELGKRLYLSNIKNGSKLDDPFKVFNCFKDLFYKEKQELFVVAYLNIKKDLINYKILFKGTINKSTVSPREIFKYAYIENASSFICIHNHPSGYINPSFNDSELTFKIKELSNILGINFCDHLIISNDKYYSYKENNLL